MSAPQRRRPGASSPIKLTANVEPVRTGAPDSTDEPRPPRVQEAAVQPAKEPTVPSTVSMRLGLKRRAQTAVLRTAGLPGGYRSFAALIDGALERELQRLADAHNEGVPYEPNEGEFRTGRPFGT